MRIKPRKIKKYKPRRRKSNKSLVVAQIMDIERILEMDLGSYIILCKEGTKKQIESARIKMKSHILKYGPDMKMLANTIGEGLPELVNRYINSMNPLIKDNSCELDSGALNEHRKQALELRKKVA